MVAKPIANMMCGPGRSIFFDTVSGSGFGESIAQLSLSIGSAIYITGVEAASCLFWLGQVLRTLLNITDGSVWTYLYAYELMVIGPSRLRGNKS